MLCAGYQYGLSQWIISMEARLAKVALKQVIHDIQAASA
jgi:hypothetical protein